MRRSLEKHNAAMHERLGLEKRASYQNAGKSAARGKATPTTPTTPASKPAAAGNAGGFAGFLQSLCKCIKCQKCQK